MPSPFYALVEGASEVMLEFPVDQDSRGPFWDDDGELDLTCCVAWDQEDVAVVPLGGDRHRLAELVMGPFSKLRLYWGDEFTADKGEDGTLRVTSVRAPRPLAHYRFITSHDFGSEDPIAQHLHALGGGWETFAGGILTLTVPAEHAGELQRLMHAERLAPGVIALET